MQRREFITILGGAAAAWPLGASAQEPGRTYRLGSVQPNPRDGPHFVAFFDELRRLGFIEGQNLTVDGRGFGLHINQFAEIAAEMVRAKVDVILCAGDVAARAAQQATTTIPIVAVTDDMVASGLVPALAKPGGNTTGVSIFATELDGKRQELLIEALPGLRRMAALADTTQPLRADRKDITYDQHPDHQFRINRRAARGRVVRGKFTAQPGKIKSSIDLPHQMIFRHCLAKTKLVEQLTLVTLQTAHHGSTSPRFASTQRNHGSQPISTDFCNKIGTFRTSSDVRLESVMRSIVLQNSKIERRSKSRESRFLLVSVAATAHSADAKVRGRFCAKQ